MAKPATRLAPSPTGHLHLGHAWSFLCTWALARGQGWSISLRLEDLDADRASPEAREDTFWCLSWLGIDWDGAPELQSKSGQRHADAMMRLARDGRVFAAPHSRAQVRAAVGGSLNHQPGAEAHAPHEGDAVLRFPASLRPVAGPAWRFTDTACTHRFACPPGAVAIEDQLLGPHTLDPSQLWGDPIVWMKSGVPSYQLAVVVDDRAAGVTEVVRGRDLLDSAVLQSLLHEALGGTPPHWWHLPLVADADGRRLAKRHDALSLRALEAMGATPARVRALVVHWADGGPLRDGATPDDLRARVTPDALRRVARAHPRLIVTPDIVRWLCHGA